ncbi:hypothetical protein FOZ62_001255, partial [Perkinsus olseni]
RWESTNCDVSIRNILTRKVHHRTPQQLGIPTKASPCSLEWGEESSSVPSDLIEHIIVFINSQHSRGSACLDLELSPEFTPTMRRTTDESAGIVRLRLRPQELTNVSMLYDVELIGDTPQFAEPRETYMSFQVCMPKDTSSFNKLTCLCNKFAI